MKTTFRTSALIFIVILTLSCRNSNENFEPYSNEELGYNENFENEFNQNKIERNNTPLSFSKVSYTAPQNNSISLEQKQANLQIYFGWNNYAYQISEFIKQMCQTQVRQIQTNIQLLMQNYQMAGMAPDQNLIQSYQHNIQQAQIQYYRVEYLQKLTIEQNKLLQSLSSNTSLLQNDSLFAQATSFNAVILYYCFNNQAVYSNFNKVLPIALKWYMSPQANYDIQNGLAQLKQRHQINMASFNNIPSQSGSSILNNDNFNERFSDVLLDQQTWIDPQTGDKYKLPIEIENPVMNGYEMIQY